MTLPRIFILLITLGIAAAPVFAQGSAEAQAGNKTPAQPAQASGFPGSHISTVNVQVEITISDYSGTGAPQKKTVSVIVADGYIGRVRAPNSMPQAPLLNVDATPRLTKDGRVALQLGLEYRPPDDVKSSTPTAAINEVLTVLLHSGKPLAVTQAADPAKDRKVVVEVTATILK